MQDNHTKYIDGNQDNRNTQRCYKSGKQRPWREKKIDNLRFCCKVRNIV